MDQHSGQVQPARSGPTLGSSATAPSPRSAPFDESARRYHGIAFRGSLITEEIRQLIPGQSAQEISRAAARVGYRVLRYDGMRTVLVGLTTIGETEHLLRTGRLNTMTPTPAIDAETVNGLRDLNPDDPNFLRELIDMFVQDVPERVAEIERALAKQDAVLLTRAAHTIKGSSGNFGAAGLARVSLEMEDQGRKAAFTEAAAMLPALKSEFATVVEALKAFR